MGGTTFTGLHNSIKFQRKKYCKKNKSCNTCLISNYCAELAKAEQLMLDVASKINAEAASYSIMGYVK